MSLNRRALEIKAARLRKLALETALAQGKGHVPPAFSWMEIAVALYHGGALRHRPAEPDWAERDVFLLGKGHGCLSLYAVLADLGFFPMEEMARFAHDGALLPGHPDPLVPGVESLSGSLGHALSLGAGFALSLAMDGSKRRVFVLLGDGECQEGAVWEAAMFASHHKLGNLTAILDRNRLSATDFTENVTGLEPVDERWRAFGWEVESVDGHDVGAVIDALQRTGARKPRFVIANTIKGKGVDFMQNSPNWHHQLPKGEQAADALLQLDRRIRELEG